MESDHDAMSLMAGTIVIILLIMLGVWWWRGINELPQASVMSEERTAQNI